jgi:hypothetical protein
LYGASNYNLTFLGKMDYSQLFIQPQQDKTAINPMPPPPPPPSSHKSGLPSQIVGEMLLFLNEALYPRNPDLTLHKHQIQALLDQTKNYTST